MAFEPIKRGPGRPRKEEASDTGPIGKLHDVPGAPVRDDRHVLVPAPDDPNQDAPLPETARATVTSVPEVKAQSADAKKAEDDNEKINRQRERRARSFAVRDAPIAQAVFDAEDDPKEQKLIPVTLKKGYFPLDGGDKVAAGTLFEMTKAELRAAKEAGIADVSVEDL